MTYSEPDDGGDYMKREEGNALSPDAYAIVLGLRLIASELALLRRDLNERSEAK